MSEKRKSTKPYQSKLIPYQEEIFKLWWSRKTLKDIQKYLETKDLEISLQGISSFIRRRNKRPDPHYIADHLKHLLEDKSDNKKADISKIPTPEEYLRTKK